MNDRDYEDEDESELLGSEAQEWESELDESELDGEDEGEASDEVELAAELLEVSGDQELDRFLGKIFRQAGRAAKGLIASPAGQQLKGMLRGALRQALPRAGRAVGTYLGGAGGGDAGAGLATQAGQLFGLELEGLSAEDQELEVARRAVRLSQSAVRQLARSPQRRANPRNAAASAMAKSARRHAPGMATRKRKRGASTPSPRLTPRSSGRWIRRNGTLVLLDL
jgi:hypothetical protein